MRIALVCPYYAPAICGVGQVVRELGTRYVKAGHEVHVFCSDSDKKGTIPIKEEVIDGVHVHRCKNWFTVVNFATIFPSVYSRLKGMEWDVIHSHASGHVHHFLAALAARETGTPHVHTTHCPWTSGFRSLLGRVLVPVAYNTIMRLAFAWADANVGITPWEVQFLEKYGVDDPLVIRNGMQPVLYGRVKKNDFRKKHGIPARKKVVLFFGRLNATKGPEHLARAGVQLVKERNDVFFLFVGPDEGRAALVQEIMKGQKDMKYIGPLRGIQEIAKMYQSSDVYVLPSYREGLPLTLFEAMASGLPVIASPVNGVPFEMKEDVNGLFVQYGDVNGLKDAIVNILDHPKLAKKFSVNNVKKSRGYSWDDIAREYLRLYKSVIARKHSDR